MPPGGASWPLTLMPHYAPSWHVPPLLWMGRSRQRRWRPSGRALVQAVAVTLGQFLLLLALIQSRTEACAEEASIVLFFMMACIRRLHLARSRLLEMTDAFVHGHCLRGKCRRKGVHASFKWAVPRPTWFGSPAFSVLDTLSQKLGNPSFIIPARAVAQALRPRRWLARPMGHSMTLRTIRSIFHDARFHRTS